MTELFTVVAAAGKGKRLLANMNKAFVKVRGVPILVHTLAALNDCADCYKTAVAVAPAEVDFARQMLADYKHYFPRLSCFVVAGGRERQNSVYNALQEMPEGSRFVVVHDGARPFITPALFGRVLEAARARGAAIAAVTPKDTVKAARDSIIERTLDRDRLLLVQTPQIFSVDVLLPAYENAFKENFFGTDDASLVERLGYRVVSVEGDYANIKITTPEDLFLAKYRLGDSQVNFRVGNGYDVHRLIKGRKLIVGGVELPYELGLDGHSDADVLLHAITDAMLGAAGLGDIGKHFPDTDAAYKGADSLLLLQEAVGKLGEGSWRVNNIDAVIIAQRPKMAPYIEKMRENIAMACQVAVTAVNVKATTTEELGFAGRGEGIAAQASVSLVGR